MPVRPRSKLLAGNRAYALVLASLLAVTGVLVGVATFGLEVQSQVRAYVAGEGHWSKGQKDAVHSLLRYASSRAEADYQQFLAGIEVQLGDRRAREELDKPDYDFAVVHQGFIAGGNAPEDTAGMASLYRRFYWLDYLARCIRIWRDADVEIAALRDAGERLHRAIQGGVAPDDIRGLLDEVGGINARVTRHEDDFSSTLGDAARWLNRLLVKVLIGVGVLLLAIVGRLLWTLLISLSQAQDEARRAEALRRSLVDDSPIGIFGSRADGSLVAVNPAMVAMLGYASEEEVLRLNLGRDVYADPSERARLLEIVPQRGIINVESRWRRKDGSLLDVRLSGRRVQAAEPEVEQFNVIVEDVSDTRLLQEQLRHAQKMEAVGQLAGGVAHDFNNLLTAILGSASLLQESLPPGHPAREEADEIHKAGLRATELTRQLLAFGRKQALALRVVDLNRITAETGSLMKRLLGETIKLRTELAPDLRPTRADPSQLEQVLVNLAVNARDAMPDGGTLTLRTANVLEREVPADAGLPPPQGDHVLISVTDDGTGMDAETLRRAFEPFFTTKPRGKGTGLGLATVYGIVRQSGGRIRARSEPGRGATFEIYLPSVAAEPEVVRAPEPERAPPRGSERVLVVEDQAEVRRLTSKLLRAHGYEVLEASDGPEALRISGREPGAIHLLATDVIMPGMNGRQVALALEHSRPAMRVLYLSGYADESIVRHGVLEPGLTLLAKPFTAEALARTVREVLDAPGPSHGSEAAG